MSFLTSKPILIHRLPGRLLPVWCDTSAVIPSGSVSGRSVGAAIGSACAEALSGYDSGISVAEVHWRLPLDLCVLFDLAGAFTTGVAVKV